MHDYWCATHVTLGDWLHDCSGGPLCHLGPLLTQTMFAAVLCTRFKPQTVTQLGLSVQKWSHTYAPSCVPVVIVGAGPSGLVLSCLLSQYGVRHMVLEKSKQLTQHPQAHYINNRTMEVFRGIPGLSAEVSAVSPPLDQWRKFIYCEGMAAGQLLGEVDHFPGQDVPQDPAVSAEPVTHLSQHRLLPLLLKHAQALSAANGHCADIRFSRTVTAVSNVEFPHRVQQPHKMHAPALAAAQQGSSGQHQQKQHQQQRPQGFPDGIAAQEYPVCIAVQSSAADGGEGQQLVRCSYLAAADGAHSGIRRLLGIPMSGEPALQHLMSIHFKWPGLGAALQSAGRQGMLYFVFNRQLVAVMVAHDLDRGEFVAQVPYYPPLQSPRHFTADVCKHIIAAAAGWPIDKLQLDQVGRSGTSAGFQLHSVKNWVMSALVADEYLAWGSRVMLVGDAAHRFPPAGGFGMNTGIQDAHNLAWKLAAVISGVAEHGILNTYQQERQPIATANTKLSVSNWQEALRVPQALGLDPRAASLVNQLVSAAPLPSGISRWLLDSALAAGRGMAAAVTPLRKSALQGILRSGQSLRLQFPKEDLGFVYQQGAVDVDGSNSSSSSTGSGGSRGSPFVPSTAVGGRSPHCRLMLLDKGNSQKQVSTLDLVTPDVLGLNMLLICSSSSSSSQAGSDTKDSWLLAGQQLQQQGWPLKLLQVLTQGTQHNSSNCRALSSSSSNRGGSPCAGTPAHSTPSERQKQQQEQHCGVLQAVDVDGSWAHLHRGCSSVAVLVRPDGHVAWRRLSSSSSSEYNAAATDELQRVLTTVLCLQPPGPEAESA